MSFLTGLLKTSVVVVLIVAIAIPLRYGSTDYPYLRARVAHSLLTLRYSFAPDPDRPRLTAEYRAFETLLRLRPLLADHLYADPSQAIKLLRLHVRSNNVSPKPSECQIDKEVFVHNQHSTDGFWINHPPRTFQKKTDKLLLYFHGGGYVFGDIETYRGFECYLSQLFNMTVLHLEYRLCPEHTLPHAVEDAVAIYRAILNQDVSSSQIMIMGDSAGGGLSLLTTQTLLTQQLPLPRGVIVLSPWADISISSESHTRNKDKDVMLRFDQKEWLIEQLLGSNLSQLSADHHSVSPLFGSFEGFPSLFINVGTAETLEDDARKVFAKAKEAKVDVTFEEGEHLMHVYPMFFGYFPEARRTLENIRQWIQTKFNQ
ncbi:unnamed protein product [Adineta ricciae]|uniref:Alpha/beta hydrolase fold-3 domain-containing protein n=1 Tax=Adineta ricciae TaxID=249248 RepID=A0A814Y507_ADIRI|nr:unnamed protein product [Adineta ricciae]